MESLADRARAVMNLILLGTIALLWAVTRPSPEVLGLSQRILEYEWWPNGVTLSEPTKRYRGYVFADDAPFDRDTLVRQVRIGDLAGLLTPITVQQSIEVTGEARPDKLAKLEELAVSVRAFDAIYRDSGLSSDATVADLERVAKPRIELPIVEASVVTSEAVRSIAIAMLPMLLYLVSISQAIRFNVVDRQADPSEAADWLFLHPGYLGPALGIAWLLFSPILLLIAAARGIMSWYFALPVAVVLVGFVGLMLRPTLKSRRVFLETRSASANPSAAPDANRAVRGRRR